MKERLSPAIVTRFKFDPRRSKCNLGLLPRNSASVCELNCI